MKAYFCFMLNMEEIMNNKKQKFFTKLFYLMALVLTFSIGLTACTGNEKPKQESSQESDKPKVTVTTSFLEDMATVLAGDFVDIDIIVPAGADPHVYVAKPEDYDKIEKADLLLYHGLHFEGKMIDALEKKGVAISSNFPEDKLIKITEDGENIVDPHFWFDIELYKMAVDNAKDSLVKLLPDKKDDIEKNATAYKEELDKTKEYGIKKMSEIPKENRYLITPHDAFNYFSRTFDIEVVAPQGVSTDSEVANKDLSSTVDFIVEHEVKSIFAESTTDPARMEKLKQSCKEKNFDVNVVSGEGKELYSDSLASKGEKGDTFISMLTHNIDLITENLK